MNPSRELAKNYGLYEAIPGELWGCDLTKLSSVFVEKVKEGVYCCYKLTWNDGPKQPREIKSEKVYLDKADLEDCLNRAKYVIDWYELSADRGWR